MQTIGQMLKTWRRFVQLVKMGYDENIYEYENDLSIRESIEEVLNGNADNVAEGDLQSLKEIDNEFLAVTFAVADADPGKSGFWNRYPTFPGPPLKEDMISNGIIGEGGST